MKSPIQLWLKNIGDTKTPGASENVERIMFIPNCAEWWNAYKSKCRGILMKWIVRIIFLLLFVVIVGSKNAWGI